MERRFSRPREMEDKLELSANDDLESIFLDFEQCKFEESEPSTSQISANNGIFSNINTSNKNTESNLATDSSFILLQEENFLTLCPSSCSLSVPQSISTKPSTLPSISELEKDSSEFHSTKTIIPDYIEGFRSTLIEQNEVQSSTCIAGSSNDYCRQAIANENATSNLESESSFIQLHDGNFLSNRPSSCPLSVPLYSSTKPSTLSSISESKGDSRDSHGIKTNIRDYIEAFTSTLGGKNEVESFSCVDVSSNEEYREVTDVKNLEKCGTVKYDSVEECAVDDPNAFPGSSYLHINKTNNLGCLNKFQSNSTDKRYSVVHTDIKRFICNVCRKGFKQMGHLKAHIFVHEIVKPFKCGSCGKMFAQKIYLKVHVRSHTGEKPFLCDICEKSFTQKCNLQAHIRCHMGEKPFSCEVCGKRFTAKRSLDSHKKNRLHK